MEKTRTRSPLPPARKPDDKFGLVLGGGGSKGCYHVGVWQAFNEAGIAFDAVTGTSIGALVGIFYPGNRIETVTDFVMNMQPQNIAQDLPVMPMTLKEKVKGSKTVLSFIIKYFETRMDIRPLREHFQNMFDYTTFKQSPVLFACMSYNDTKKEARAFFKGEITPENAEDIVMASSACYPAFPKVTINDEVYMDGMYADNVPIDLLKTIQPDSKWIAVVDLHDPAEPKPPALDDSMFYIEPLLNPGNPLDFSPAHANRLYAQGYLETQKRLGKMRGYLYTFLNEDQSFIDIVETYLTRQTAQMKILFPKMDRLDLHVLKNALGYQPGWMPVTDDPGYEFGRYVEALALIAHVDPIALYSYPDFLRMILANLNAHKTEETSDEYRLVELLHRMKKEESVIYFHKLFAHYHGRLPEKIDALKERFMTSYTLGWVWYCMETLLNQLDVIQQREEEDEVEQNKDGMPQTESDAADAKQEKTDPDKPGDPSNTPAGAQAEQNEIEIDDQKQSSVQTGYNHKREELPELPNKSDQKNVFVPAIELPELPSVQKSQRQTGSIVLARTGSENGPQSEIELLPQLPEEEDQSWHELASLVGASSPSGMNSLPALPELPALDLKKEK